MFRMAATAAALGGFFVLPICASASPSARLVYVRDPAGAHCPDEVSLREAVKERVGYDPFFPWAKTTVVVEVTAEGPTFVAHVRLVDESGLSRGVRELRSGPAGCHGLIDAAALAISIALDMNILDVAEPGPPSPAAAAPGAIPAPSSPPSSSSAPSSLSASGSAEARRDMTAPAAGPFSVSTLANFEQSQTIGDYGAIGVTSTTVFLAGGPGPNQVASFPLSAGVVDGGVPAVVAGASQGCEFFVSDTDAVYCDANGYIARIASDGTTVTLGTVITSLVLSNATTGSGIAGAIAIDDTYVYWVDGVTVGTIMRVPKTGGTATVIARDTNPVAIAADSNAVYWSDQGGNIMRLAK
jgi:hypothetical protein